MKLSAECQNCGNATSEGIPGFRFCNIHNKQVSSFGYCELFTTDRKFSAISDDVLYALCGVEITIVRS